MHLESILSYQEKRKVANDYTIRLDNQVYQLLKPALPCQRGGWVIVEKRLDGTMHIRFKKTYLAYHLIGPADRLGALPPNPRSLSHAQTPAGRKEEGPTAKAARPSAVRLSHFEGRSYVGLMRHMILCQLVVLFLAEQTKRINAEVVAAAPDTTSPPQGGKITPA